ncbi:MAG: acyltransferase [Bacteroidota bacterium]
MNKPARYIPSLTPLRGIAALMVVLFHYNDFLVFQDLSNLNSISMILAKGYLWVDFFFVLSGFIICHVYGERLLKPTGPIVRKYLWARFSRLYPLHVFALLLCIPLIGFQFLLNEEMSMQALVNFYQPSEFFIQLFFLQVTGITHSYAWNVPSWSIAAEWWVYILAVGFFPLLNRGFNWRTIVSWALALAGLTLMVLNHPDGKLDEIFELATVRCLCSFLIGIGVYQVYEIFRDQKGIWAWDGTFFFLALSIILCLHFAVFDIVLIPLFAALILSAALNEGKAAKILNQKGLTWLGDISFSVYLIHMSFLQVWWIYIIHVYRPQNPDVDASLGEKLMWIGALLVVILAFGHISYRYVELPAQKWLRGMWKDASKEIHADSEKHTA